MKVIFLFYSLDKHSSQFQDLITGDLVFYLGNVIRPQENLYFSSFESVIRVVRVVTENFDSNEN